MPTQQAATTTALAIDDMAGWTPGPLRRREHVTAVQLNSVRRIAGKHSGVFYIADNAATLDAWLRNFYATPPASSVPQ